MSSENTSSGISFGSMLVILFIGLKLTGYIAWSWWWVFSPFWIPIVIAIAVVLLILVGKGIASMF